MQVAPKHIISHTTDAFRYKTNVAATPGTNDNYRLLWRRGDGTTCK